MGFALINFCLSEYEEYCNVLNTWEFEQCLIVDCSFYYLLNGIKLAYKKSLRNRETSKQKRSFQSQSKIKYKPTSLLIWEKQSEAGFSAFSPAFIPVWIIFSLSFLSKHQRQVGLCGSRLHVSPRPSIAMTCCLSDKHSRCWHYQMLSACRPPRAFALLWPLDEVSGPATWLWGTLCVYVCVSEQAWTCMCMLQIDLPLVCHIKLALCWPPSCLQAVLYIPQLSPATLRT